MLAPDVKLRPSQITMDQKTMAVAPDIKSLQQQFQTNSSTKTSHKPVSGSLVIPKSQIRKEGAPIHNESEFMQKYKQNNATEIDYKHNNTIIIGSNQPIDGKNLLNSIAPLGVAARTIIQEDTYSLVTPTSVNHKLAQIQSEALLHQNTSQDEEDSSQNKSDQHNKFPQSEDEEADRDVQIILSHKGSGKLSQKSRQSRLQIALGEKEFSVTAKQSKALLESFGIEKQINHTPDLVKPIEAKNEPNIAEIKKQMLQEQRDNQQSATGHEAGSSSLKLVGVHILEMYNPLKNFYAQQPKLGKEKETSKKDKKQIDINEKALKESKATESDALATIIKSSKLAQTGSLTVNESLEATMTSQKTGNRKNQSVRFRQAKLVVNAFFSKYPILRKVVRLDFKMKIEETDVEDADIIWCDHCLPLERIQRMRPYQRTNHFPGMHALTRKDSLGKNLNGLYQLFPDAYNFYPRTWLIPNDIRKLKADWKENADKQLEPIILIVKPQASCQGKGIYLTREIEDIEDQPCVVQEYINKPFLMERMKFDLRLYVLVLGIDPLRIYLSREGLARLSTKIYEEVDDTNLDDMTMHLTNYAINKHSAKFQPNRAAILDSAGHKRSLKFSLKYLEKCEGQNTKKLMKEIKDIIVKTLIAGQPMVADTVHSCLIDDFENSVCFEILGFDIMLDYKCKPYLLEVNHSPSFSTDSPLDEKVKGELIRDTIRLLGLSKKRKQMYSKNLKAHLEHRIMNGKFIRLPQNLKDQYRKEYDKLRDIYEQQNLGSFEQLYPCSEELMQEFEYDKLLKASRKIYNQKDARHGSKAKRRTTTISQNKSLSPNKRDRTNLASKIASAHPIPMQENSQAVEPREMKMQSNIIMSPQRQANLDSMHRQQATEMTIQMQQFQQIIAGSAQKHSGQQDISFAVFPIQQMGSAQKIRSQAGSSVNYQYLQTGAKNQQQEAGLVYHNKTMSNASSIAYPFQTPGPVNPNINSNQKPLQNGKRANEFLNDISPLMSIQQTTLHNKSPSPRVRHNKMQPITNQGHPNTATYQIGIPTNSQSRTLNRALTSTEPQKNSAKQGQVTQQVVATTHFTMSFGQPLKHPVQDDDKEINKRTIIDGFRKSDGEAIGIVNPTRVQTGLQRRFETNKNSKVRLQNAVLPQSISIIGKPHNQQQIDFGEGNDAAIEEQLQLLNQFQHQVSGTQARVDNSQIMHLYRMSVGQGSKISNYEPESFQIVGQIIGAEAPNDKKVGSASNKQRQNYSNQVIGQPPRSAASNSQHQGNLHSSNISGAQASAKRDSNQLNFISQHQKEQQQKLIGSSQEKLRRKLSKEYCPMIIKSSNKNVSGSANSNVVKGVLHIPSQQKARVESSLKNFQNSTNSRAQYVENTQPSFQAVGDQSGNQQEILKTQSHQQLFHKQTSAKGEQRFSGQVYQEHSDCFQDEKERMLEDDELYYQNLVGSPVQRDKNNISNHNTFEDNRIQQSLDLVENSQALETFEEKPRIAMSNGQMKVSEHSNLTKYIQRNVAEGSQWQKRSNAINDESDDETSRKRKELDLEGDETPPTIDRQGSHLQQIQMMSNKAAGRQVEGVIRHPSSALSKLKSPQNKKDQQNFLQKQMSLQQNTPPLNLITSKIGQSMETDEILTGQSTTTNNMNNRVHMQQKKNQVLASDLPPGSLQISYKLATPSQQSTKQRMAQVGAQVPMSDSKANRAAAQRIGGARGSSTLPQTANNNANSQTNQVGVEKQSRATSQHRHHAAKQHDVNAASVTATGGFLRPKVLDFQPKTGQVDPLLANRSRKRGAFGAGNIHNQPPGIISNGSSNNQNNYGARFNAGSGVFRHF